MSHLQDNNTFRLDGKVYPAHANVSIGHLATFPPRVTFGEPTARDEEYLSNWAIRKIPGGVGIEEYDEGTDAERIWWGKIDSRYGRGITLPPLVRATRPSTVPETAVSLPLGVIGTQHYTCFSWSTNHHVFAWNETAAAWNEPAAPNALVAAPVGKAVTFAGTTGIPFVFVPQGAAGYSVLAEADIGLGTVTITNVAGASDPDAMMFCVFTVAAVSQLYAMEADGHLYLSGLSGASGEWTQPSQTINSVATPIKLDASETPKHLFVYKAPDGNRALHVMSNRAMWVYNPMVPCFERTEFELSPHPHNALGLAVWRPGENVHVTQGLERWQHAFPSVEIPNTGPARDDGVPAQFRGALVDLIPETSFLWALLLGSSVESYAEPSVEDGGTWYDDASYLNPNSAYSALLCDTSLGWHVLWESATPVTLTWGTIADLDLGYALWFGGNKGDVYRVPLRAGFHNAQQGAILGLDSFADTGYFITGWFDAAMLNFDKIAADLSVTMKHATTTEYVEAFYQIDDNTTWVSLGRATAKGKTTLRFGTDADGFARGVAFNQIRFRFNFARGTTVTTSPVFTAFSLHFVKISQDAQTFEVAVDLVRENWTDRSADQMRDDLAALLVSRRFVEFEHARRRYRVLLTRLGGDDATGQDEQGSRSLTLLALEELEAA